MNKELVFFDIKDFKNINAKNIEETASVVYKLAKDSVISNKTEDLENSFKSLSNSFEKISNILELDDPKNLACFHFGQINSVTNIILDIANNQKSSKEVMNVAKSYPLLLPALKIIKEYNTITGMTLQKELNMKTSSNLSNFLKRIKKFNLVSVKKIGTINYISLTRKGDKFLSESIATIPEIDSRAITIAQLYSMLDGISEELSEPSPSSIKVVHNFALERMSINEKRLLKHKLDRIFYARDNYFRTRFKSINAISSDKVFDTYKDKKNKVYEIKTVY